MNNATCGAGAGSSPSVTDASLVLPGTLNILRSTSVNNMRIPTSPMSFSSNNMNVPGSSILDGSAGMQPLPQPQLQQQQQQQQLLQGASSVTALPIQQVGQASVPMVPNNIGHVDKKPRIEVKQEDMLQQHILQQLLQQQDPMGRNPQLQVLLQQQRLRQQQQHLLQSMSPSQRLQLQQQQQQQLRQQLQQQGMQQIPPKMRPFEGCVCARRLMMYLYHQQQRPPENCITYWRKFVAEYYSPRAKQRLCLSQYDSAGHHALGMFPQAAPDMWHCDLCGTKSGRGFEASYDVLARLNEIKFGSGIIDELLYLDFPRESRFPSGLMMLEYRKAVQETVHEQFRVVREGHLRIIFTQDLKILSWEFCARRHEELFLRRLVSPQVNQLVQVSQKCQSTISESGSEGVSQQDLQSNSNMVLAAGRQLVKFLELPSLNDLGYPKRYIRTLQIAEVVKSMKDLMNFSGEHKIGPIEGLKRLSEQTVTAKLQRQKMQEMEQLANSAPNGQMVLPQGMMNSPSNSNSNNHHQMVGRGALSGSAQAAMALTNYQSMLMRQNGMNNPNINTVQQGGLPSSFSNPSPTTNPSPSPASSSLQRQNLPVAGVFSPRLSPQMQQQLQQQRTINNAANMVQQNHHLQPLQGNNQAMQQQQQQQQQQQMMQQQQQQEQQMMQQLLQEMSNNGGGGGGIQQRSFSGQSVSNSNAERNATPSNSNVSGGGGPMPRRSNSFKAASNNNNINNNNGQRTPDLPQNFHLAEDISVPELPHDFTDDGFFNNNDLYGL